MAYRLKKVVSTYGNSGGSTTWVCLAMMSAITVEPPTEPPLTVARPLEVTLRSPPIVPPVTRIAGADPLADITLAMLFAAPPVAPTVPFCMSTPPWAATA